MASTSAAQLAVMIEGLRQDVARLKRGAATPQLSSSSLEDGAILEHDDAGTLVGVIGKQPDGSHTHAVLDGPTPLQPTDPTCEGRALAIAVTHDGHLIDPATGAVDASLAPFADHEGTEIHVGDTEGFLPSSDTYAGELRTHTGGTLEVPATAGTKHVRLRGRSQAGKHGPPSPSVAVVVAPLVDLSQFATAQNDIASSATLLDAVEDRVNGLDGLVNPEFAENQGVWTDLSSPAPPGRYITLTADAHPQGRLTAYQWDSGAGEKVVRNLPLPTEAGEQWLASAWFRCTGTSSPSSVRLIVRFFRADGTQVGLTAAVRVISTIINTGWALLEGTAVAPAGAVTAVLELRQNDATGVTTQVASGRMRRKAGAKMVVADEVAAALGQFINARIENLVVTSGANMAQATILKLAAQLLEAMHVKAENVDAGNILVRLRLTANGELLVGDENQIHVTIKNGEVTVWKPGTQNPDGSFNPKTKQIILGGATGGAFEAFDLDGPLGGTKADGTMHTPHMKAARITLAGQDIEKRFVEQAGAALGRGSFAGRHFGYSAETMVAGVAVPHFPAGKRVRIDLSLRCRVEQFDVAPWLTIRFRLATNGAAANLNSPIIATRFIENPAGSLEPHRSVWATWSFSTNQYTNKILVTVQPSSGTASTRDYAMLVTDIGLASMRDTMYDAYVAPPSQPFKSIRDFIEKHTYSQSGRNVSFSPSLVRTGTGGNSIYRTYLPIPEASRQEIMSSLVTPTVKVFLQFAADNSPLDPHTGTTTTSVFGDNDDAVAIANAAQAGYSWTGPGDGEWFTLTTAQVTAIRTGGARAIVIGRETGSPLISFYGVNAGAPGQSGAVGYRPKIEVSGMTAA